jgi:hypothetical protein
VADTSDQAAHTMPSVPQHHPSGAVSLSLRVLFCMCQVDSDARQKLEAVGLHDPDAKVQAAGHHRHAHIQGSLAHLSPLLGDTAAHTLRHIHCAYGLQGMTLGPGSRTACS